MTTAEPTMPPPPRTARWLWPALTVGLAGLGLIALAAAVLPPADAAASAPPAATARPATPTAMTMTPSVAPTLTAEPDSGERRTTELPDRDWLTRTATATDIPERALAAYAGAALATAESSPSCKVGWNTLAAIGAVESEHGSFGGATLGEDGTVSPAVIGPALDGKKGARVADTDDGELDGDDRWDHAVGPMQFLPASWSAHAIDADRDGSTDVNDLDDATLAAAGYLCKAGGGDLTVPGNWIAAIKAYNAGAAYNNAVARLAQHYADRD